MSSVINLDIAKRVDIVCRKGDTMTFSITMTDSNGDAINVSSYSFKMQVRSSDTDATDVATEAPHLPLELTNSSGITVSGDSNNIITVTSSDIDFSGMYVYDLQATDGNSNVATWLYGTFKVNEDVTF